MDKILILLGEACLKSNQLALKFIKKSYESEDGHCGNCVKVAEQMCESDILDDIFINGELDTYSKRDTVAKKNFNFIEGKKLPLGKNIKLEDRFIGSDFLKNSFIFSDFLSENKLLDTVFYN